VDNVSYEADVRLAGEEIIFFYIHQKSIAVLTQLVADSLIFAHTYSVYLRHVIIIILVITFMQGIYNYIPETNSVSRLCSGATVLCLLFVLHVMLFPS